MLGSPNHSFFILGQAIASPSHTRGGSRMRESRPYGSVRGARGETRVPTATAARTDSASWWGGCIATDHVGAAASGAGNWVPQQRIACPVRYRWAQGEYARLPALVA